MNQIIDLNSYQASPFVIFAMKPKLRALIFLMACCLCMAEITMAHVGVPDPISPKELNEVPRELRNQVKKYDVNALLSAAQYFENGKRIKKDDWKAARWYLRAADQDSKEAFVWIENAAARGNAAAQFYVGANKAAMGQRGEAMELFQLSAQQHYPEAMQSLGNAYLLGEGVKQDYNQAVDWLRQSAQSGKVVSFNLLATAYGTVDSPLFNASQAFYFLLIAKRLGSGFAELQLKNFAPLVNQRPDIVAHASQWKLGTLFWEAHK